ncbi:uncharacterized protein BDV17DRAFT_293295 [Aspergillus undulatus]|uniref:uncharacterized protein n=1 Tax=Aspergillus undulatus TaxID=1810928 RepID=UPI003CCDFEE9
MVLTTLQWSATLETWIELDNTHLSKYNLKKQLFECQRAKVLAVLPECDDGAFEGLEPLKETLVGRYPTGWKIESRIGKPLWGIHASRGVPQYGTKLAQSMDRFFQRMKPGSMISRYNYAIDNSDDLFHRRSHHNLTAEQVQTPELKDLHLRVERQVL